MKKEMKIDRKDWEKMGAYVKVAYMAVIFAEAEVGKNIGESKSETKLLNKAYEDVKKAKNQLDELVCRIDDDNHVIGDEAIRVFFGDYIGEQPKYARELADCLAESLLPMYG